MVSTEARTAQRIHILGAAGSGKTTLARQCAGRLNSPWYELDTIAYEGGYARKRTLDERMQSISEITMQSVWVTEGIFLWWIDDLLEAADVIVWLDLPWTVSMTRVITRHFRLSWAGKNRHSGLWKLAKFVWWCRLYYLEKAPRIPKMLDDDSAIDRVTVAQYLEPYMEKVVQCRRPTDVKQFLSQVEYYGNDKHESAK